MKKVKPQWEKIYLGSAAFIMMCLAFFSIFGEWGLMDLLEQQQEKNQIITANADIVAENQIVARKIRRLKDDRQYIESVIRKELGVVQEDDLVIKMSPVGQGEGSRQR